MRMNGNRAADIGIRRRAPAEAPMPPPAPDEVTRVLNALRDDINALHRERNSQRPDPARITELEGSIRAGIARITRIHPDPGVRADYRTRLAAFDGAANESAKWDVLIGIGTGLGIVLAAPFAIVGGAILLGGSIILGTGQALKVLGTVLTSPITDFVRNRYN
jgi:hypothetical protein